MRSQLANGHILLLILLATFSFQSCNKTEYSNYESEEANRILEYRITNTQQELLGAIDHKDNSITVYIPFYMGIEYLNAQIKLDEGATLLDSKGKTINLDGGLEPLKVGAEGALTTYTVVSAKGKKREYTIIQKVIPHGEPLKVTYAKLEEGETMLSHAVNGQFTIIGNFESSSTNAKFFLTNKQTGQMHEDYIKTVSMTPGENGYSLISYISPDALEGEYTVSMQHQGRSSKLPDLKLHYNKYPRLYGGFLSDANYAAGDTITFDIAVGLEDYLRPTIFMEVERMYIKVRPEGSLQGIPDYKYVFKVPPTFPESLYNTEIEMKIISQSRTLIKAIFPDMPAGSYTGNNSIYHSIPEENAYPYSEANFGFYIDFADNTGWGKSYIIADASSVSFTVNEKK